jgi:small subunit ribosomal protein S6
MNHYENIAILDPSLSEEEVADSIEKITSLIVKNGGEIIKSENWGKKDLAYEIHKHKKGFYLFTVFKSPSDVIKKLEDYYKVFDPVFKFLIVKLGKKEIAALIKSIQKAEEKEKAAEEVAEGV